GTFVCYTRTVYIITARSEAPMGIQNIGRRTVGEVRAEIKRGARFVVYEYVISLLVVTRRRPSPVVYIEPATPPGAFALALVSADVGAGLVGIPLGPGVHYRRRAR